MLKVAAFALIALFCYANASYAQNCPAYTYNLVNGQTADASQVMGNFNSVLNCTNTNLAPLNNPHFTGNVGIGTNNPAAALSVQGQVVQIGAANNTQLQDANLIFGDYYQGRPSDGTWQQMYWLHTTQTFIFTSSVQATSFISTSDARLKTEVQALPEGLSLVMKLRPVRFQWRTAGEREVGRDLTLPTGETEAGFIAQEVGDVIPEAVVVPKANTGMPYGLRDTAIIAVLVKALQEQQAEIAALKNLVQNAPAK